MKNSKDVNVIIPAGLGDVVHEHIKAYFLAHEGQLPASGLYKRILVEVEKPLLIAVLESVKGSQVKAAKILGLSRNTLRKKIEELHISKHASE
ncbi:MAG: hypothetical protein KBB83_06065 [Alphaproteobacteria bacterium]|nr:hypothetical protein [Alphaproteobacteria bacterium]